MSRRLRGLAIRGTNQRTIGQSAGIRAMTEFESLSRDDLWSGLRTRPEAIVDLVGKGGRRRTVPVQSCCKELIDAWGPPFERERGESFRKGFERGGTRQRSGRGGQRGLPCGEAMCAALDPSSAIASSSVFWSRPVMATWAPSAMKSRPVARPMPLLPPVIRAFFPVSFIMPPFCTTGIKYDDRHTRD